MHDMDLETLREDINGVDGQLLPLFLKRMALSEEIARVKKAQGLSIYNAKREREILSRVSREAGSMDDYARLFFSNLFELSRSRQVQLMAEPHESLIPPEADETFPHAAVVACQGIEGAYSQLAADKAFQFADIVFMKTFEGVFQAVERGLCRFGVLPIENSAHGSVTQVYDLMRQHQFSIARAVKLHIHHHLMARKGARLADIRTILSHEQALGQCSQFLDGLKNVRVQVCENTAVAAQTVAESGDGTLAAISSEDCARQYNLDILQSHIQNTDNNYTRFIIIEKTPRVYPGSNKISLMFSLPDTPGSLGRIMARFSCSGLNLSKLESRPVEGTDFHYVFYTDLEASAGDPAVRRLIDGLSVELPMFTFLGAYQEV